METVRPSSTLCVRLSGICQQPNVRPYPTHTTALSLTSHQVQQPTTHSPAYTVFHASQAATVRPGGLPHTPPPGPLTQQQSLSALQCPQSPSQASTHARCGTPHQQPAAAIGATAAGRRQHQAPMLLVKRTLCMPQPAQQPVQGALCAQRKEVRTGKPVWPSSEAKQLNALTSTISARGAHSYSSRSLAGAEGDLGLQNTPPPCAAKRTQQAESRPCACRLSCLTLAAVWVLARSLDLCTVPHMSTA